MAFTDLHEIETMFAGLVTIDTRGESLSYSQSSAEIKETKGFWQRSNRTKINARARARRAEEAALNPKTTKPPRLCSESGCDRKHSCGGRCEFHYRAHRKATMPGVHEAILLYHKNRYRNRVRTDDDRKLLAERKAAQRARQKLTTPVIPTEFTAPS